MGRALVGRAQFLSLAGQGREWWRRVFAAAGAGERTAVKARARWAAEAEDRRVTEARAHGQQRPGEEESESRHKTNQNHISI